MATFVRLRPVLAATGFMPVLWTITGALPLDAPLDVMTRSSEAGPGLAALPKLATPATRPTFKSVPLAGPTIHRVLGLIPRKDRPLQPAAATLSRTLRDSLADSPLSRP